MTDKEKIKAEVERMMAEEMQFYETACNEGNEEATGSPMAYTRLQMLLNFINSIPEEPARKDLDEEINAYLKVSLAVKFPTLDIESIKADVRYIARHFAEWQKQQMMKDVKDATVIMTHVTMEAVVPALSVVLLDDTYHEGDKVKLIIIKED